MRSQSNPSIVARSMMAKSMILAVVVLTACSSDDPNTDSADSTGGSSSSATNTTDATETTVGLDCGNDMVEDGEECDGADLGGLGCSDIDPAFVGGTLSCGETCTFDASACMISPDAALVSLNELTSESMASGVDSNDVIEIHNGGGVAADISGWTMSDDPMFDPAKTYTFPPGTMIDAGEFLVLLSIDALTSTGDFPFGISDSNEETITLADASGVVVDSVLVDGYKARVSYCRLPDASGPWFQCEQTFGAANQLAATACGNGTLEDPEECDTAELNGATCEGLGVGYTGGTVSCSPKCNVAADACTTTSDLVLNEIDATGENIEIFNGSDAAVDLSGLVLTDDNVDSAYTLAVDTGELVFAAGTMLAPGAYLVVQGGQGPGLHPFGLGLMGDRVTLADPDGPTIIDQVSYGDGEATVSYCRQPNGPGGAWTAGCAATMGGAN